ncbi:NAD(P)H nitroreductase [Shewanella sp. Scap07]|uniref:NAD(P)H nitroreductase n=1 Tax=Shewanella sp. Scap07 TaxID=2589987 RepID=UPI0015BC0FA8|nr:NAD(P)H nitroreductase [Shewanella sp. Scap07]QLE85285.1 NAD(P)H nitroreductase [Shewanella sp. Scap07]
MDAIELLTTRQSTPRLQQPGPTESQLDTIIAAGLRVPDHGGIQPFEFIIAQQAGLQALADHFVAAAKAEGGDEELLEKCTKMPFRAPMVITIVAKVTAHPKVPALEQQLAAGCAVMAMQQAAFALGLGAIWRTGGLAFNRHLHQQLELVDADQIVGFLYIGTPAVKAPSKPSRKADNVVRYL